MAEALFTLAQAAAACGGRLIGTDAAVMSVCSDSRRLAPGQLFVALRGERFDAHHFVSEALRAGAAGAIVERNRAPEGVEPSPLIEVDDTRAALAALATWWRSRFHLPLIGVTGSNGKTTVKEMIAAILRAQARQDGLDPALAVLATRGNLNNDIGVPHMLLELNAAHRYAVIEMGMNHPGEIAALAAMAKPTVALVNNAQREHLEFMHNVAQVARENGDVFEALPAQGVAVINADDDFADAWIARAGTRRVLRFGLRAPADVGAHCVPEGLGQRMTLTGLCGDLQIRLRVPGWHNASNALCAATACLAAGIGTSAIVEGLTGFGGVKGRQQLRPGQGGCQLIDDTYNANPDSVRAAIDVLASTTGTRVLVLGDMGEVGDQGPAFHREAGEYAQRRGIDTLLALGEASREATGAFGPGARHFDDVDMLVEALRPLLHDNTTVLIKGSRFMRMERVADAIAASNETAQKGH